MKLCFDIVTELFLVLLEMLWTSIKKVFSRVAQNREVCQVILVIGLLVLVWIVGVRYGENHVDIPEPEVVYQTPDPDIMRAISQYEVARTQRENDLNEISKVLYGYRYNSDRDLEGIVWVILNRVDNEAEFKNFTTISEVVNQPSQWMGYSSDNPVIEDLYSLAEDVLYKYETDGKRLFGKEYLYFEWGSEYIVFKTELYDSKTCQKWRAY